MGLNIFRGKESEKALLRAVEGDPDYSVRVHAHNTMLSRWKIEVTQEESDELYRFVRDPCENDAMQDKAARGREAVRVLKELRDREE